MTSYPPNTVRQIIDDGTGVITRRVEIYESDGNTLWQNGLTDRLVDGSISANYGSNERRTIDLTLRNNDNLLRSQPNGFWYDKVIKCFRGVQYSGSFVIPNAAVIEAVGGEQGAFRLVSTVARAGIPGARVLLTLPPISELMKYDVFFSQTGSVASTIPLTLRELFNAGKSVVTISCANGINELPFVSTTSAISETVGISQPAVSTFLSPNWTTEANALATGPAITTLAGGATIVSRYQLANASYAITASIYTNRNGGKWFDLHLPNLTGVNTLQLFANAMAWIRGIGETISWSTQIGEFVIDGISNDYYPSAVKVTGRDYVKKCLNSKITVPETFDTGTKLYALITALAANSGIKKTRLSYMPETLASSMTFDRGTERWNIMYQAAEANGYEIFFDTEGYLVTRKFLDPLLSAESNLFQTGIDGNLVSLSRSVNDSRIYNHICVYGDPSSSETRLPYFGEAINNNPASPTRIDKIGDRLYTFASTFFTDQQSVQDYANRLLSLHALESFELSFSSIAYPWMEVGEIGKVLDPKAVSSDPTKYLIDSLTMPLTLGPMSFTGKRITIVG